jgi:site-specific DNA-methyltransferase (adenine-specific)
MFDLIYGDALKEMMKLQSKSMGAIITDIPYGTTQCKWDNIIPFNPMWDQLHRIIKPNRAIALFGSEPFSSALRLSNINNFKYDWIWDKPKGTGFLNAKKRPMVNHEIISIFYEKQCLYNPIKTKNHQKKVSSRSKHHKTDVYNDTNKDYKYNSTERYPRSVQTFHSDTQNTSLHPTQKPVKLMEYFIKTYTNEGDIVLDFTMGSGTTGIACKNLNRKFVGIENDKNYFDTAVNRINNHSPQLTMC